MNDDNEIVSRSWGDPPAFAVLFDRYATTIHRYAARRAGTAVADDILAETFLVAFERRRTYDLAVPNARPWLFGIASNLLGRHARQEARQWRAYARHPRSDSGDDHEERTVARLDAEAARADLARLLAELDPADRDVLLLYAWAELPYDEIATAIGIPVGTVRSKLHRLRRRLRQQLDLPLDELTEENSHG